MSDTRPYKIYICGYRFGTQPNGLPERHLLAEFKTLVEARRYCKVNKCGVIHKPEGLEVP